MDWTRFAGLTVVEDGDAITIDGASFLNRNPLVTDRLLRIGAVTHRHDQHPALPNPEHPLDGSVVASGGSLAADSQFAVTYTLLDAEGGETIAAAPLLLSTGTTLSEPTTAPSGVVDYTQGILPAGLYYYALTYTDGVGGETTIGPSTLVVVEPGYASGAIVLSGLAAELDASHVNWRLWRSYEGEDWHLAAQGASDTYTDSGFDPPDNPAEPPAASTVGSIYSLVLTLPTVVQEPALAGATAINLYLAPDIGFASPSLYEQLPVSAAGETIVIRAESVSAGAPPHVSNAVPGATLIDPNTELVFGLKSPVESADLLPSTGNEEGDMRIAIDALTLYFWDGTAWQPLGGSTWGEPVTGSGALPASALPGEVRVALDTGELWEWHQTPPDLTFIASGQLRAADDTYIYWTENTLDATPDSKIGRAKLDGTSVEPNFITGLTQPTGLAVDDTYIYWCDAGTGAEAAIGRVNKDGTGFNAAWLPLGSSFQRPTDLAVSATHVYFTNNPFGTADWVIGFANIDGTGLAQFYDLPQPAPPSLATRPGIISIASDGNFVYWSWLDPVSDTAYIARASLTGSAVDERWLTVGPAELRPGSITFGTDAQGPAIYFATDEPPGTVGGPAKIGRADIDGTNLNLDLGTIPTIGSIWGLAYRNGGFYFGIATGTVPYVGRIVPFPGVWLPASAGSTPDIDGIDITGPGGVTLLGRTALTITASGAASVALNDLGGTAAEIVISASGSAPGGGGGGGGGGGELAYASGATVAAGAALTTLLTLPAVSATASGAAAVIHFECPAVLIDNSTSYARVEIIDDQGTIVGTEITPVNNFGGAWFCGRFSMEARVANPAGRTYTVRAITMQGGGQVHFETWADTNGASHPLWAQVRQ